MPPRLVQRVVRDLERRGLIRATGNPAGSG